MKKLGILIGILFLLTGCTADYTLSLEKDTFKENIYLYDTKEFFMNMTSTQYGIEKISEEMYRLEGQRNDFTRTLKYKDTQVGYQYETTFPIESYDTWPSLIKGCYQEMKIKKENKILTIDTSDAFLCFDKFSYAKDVNIHFTSIYPVLENNADSVDQDVYTWKISKNNPNKSLHIKVSMQKENTIFTFQNFIILIGIVGGILLLYLLLKKIKKNNEIT